MRCDYPYWTTRYDPTEHIGEASAEELCLWLQDKIYEYAGMASGVTDALLEIVECAGGATARH